MKKTFIIFATLFNLAFGATAPNPVSVQKARDDSATAHIELAVSYFQAGRPQIAQEELQKVLTIDPKNSMANDLLGLIYMRAGNVTQAEAAFQIAVASDPSNGSAQSNYGMLLCKTGRYDAGLLAFGRALQSPKQLEISQTLVNGGVCLSQKGDTRGAESFFLKALEQEPFMPAALYQLAKVYYATQRFPEAESRLAALHKQVDPNASSTYLMYQLAVSQNKTAQAQSHSRALLTRFPDSPEAQLIRKN